MIARNKKGIERFFTKYVKEVMSHNYISRRQAEELGQDWDDNQVEIRAMTTEPRQYNFKTERCLSEYLGYTACTIQL